MGGRGFVVGEEEENVVERGNTDEGDTAGEEELA